MAEGEPEPDEVLEDPMEKPEFERVLVKHLPRSDRRRFWRALTEANLIVFHGDPC